MAPGFSFSSRLEAVSAGVGNEPEYYLLFPSAAGKLQGPGSVLLWTQHHTESQPGTKRPVIDRHVLAWVLILQVANVIVSRSALDPSLCSDNTRYHWPRRHVPRVVQLFPGFDPDQNTTVFELTPQPAEPPNGTAHAGCARPTESIFFCRHQHPHPEGLHTFATVK